jgi:hypothetical protein
VTLDDVSLLAHLPGRDLPAAQDQELAYLAAVIHAFTLRARRSNWEMLAVPLS